MNRHSSQHLWMNEIVLVTGATGLVGSRLVSRLLDLGAQVVCFIRDNDPASPLWFSGDIQRVSVCNGRLESFADVRDAVARHEVRTIFHLGAQTLVGAGHRDPLGTFESNVRGTYHVLEACRLYGPDVQRIIIASSDKAYGECETLPYVESTPLAGAHPYDVSKSCADLIAQTYARTYHMPIGITRCANIFGPGDLNWSRLVPGTIRSLLNGECPIIRSDGTFLREYLYIDDAVDAYLRLAEWIGTPQTKTLNCPAFNFGGVRALSVLEMVTVIQTACGRLDLPPRVLNECRGEIRDQRLDSKRAKAILHWETQCSMEQAMNETVDWYRRYLARFNQQARSYQWPKPALQHARVSA